MKKILICTAFIFVALSIAEAFDLFSEIRKKTELGEDELVVVVYQDVRGCAVTYMEHFAMVEAIQKFSGKTKVKFIALVRVDREIELKSYKKETGWKYYMMADDGKSREKLGVSKGILLTIFNYEGKRLLDLPSGGFDYNVRTIKVFFEMI